MGLRLGAVGLGMTTAALLAGAGATIAWAQANVEQVAKERSDLMRSVSENNKILGAAAKGGQTDAKVTKAAEDIAAALTKLPTMFPAGSGDDNIRTRAKAAIWQDKAKFDGYAKDAASAFAQVAMASKAGDAAGVTAGVAKGNQACTACHKEFRGPALK